jgi:hypothetical protein
MVQDRLKSAFNKGLKDGSYLVCSCIDKIRETPLFLIA